MSLTDEQIRKAGGIVHRDGNIFFKNIDHLNSAIESAATAPLLERIAELERELEAVRKDAERYRWLRSAPNGFEAQRIVNDTPHGMDAAIDAAKEQG